MAERPDWGPRIVKGAWWRSTVHLVFFEALRRELVGDVEAGTEARVEPAVEGGAAA